ncbi:MAG: GDSL-type esterase/lipase family protein [Candidatus Sumerlaeia bacterium]|nr:GDSL-type esterase/lipase family protein [Candidatus Sumerlaeia bacterium]
MYLPLRKKLLFSAAVLLALPLSAEALVRLVCWMTGRVPYTAATPWCRADDDLLYVFPPHFEGRVFEAQARINNLGLRGKDIPEAKSTGTLRVLCLGDSRTFGYQVANEQSFPAQLELRLREMQPNSPIEVLNAGFPGYSSYQGLRFLETRGERLAPDLVTVAFDFNDRRFVLRPEQADGPAYFRQTARALRLRHRMRFSYALLGAWKVASRLRRETTWAQDVLALPSHRLPDLSCRVEIGQFRDNLRAIARWCRERQIAVVFIAMADAPPIVQAMEEGIRLRSEKHFDKAIAAFSRIGIEPPDPSTAQWCRALAQYEIGLTLEAQNRTSEALEAFRVAAQAAAFWSVFGGTPVRHSKDYVQVVCDAAGEMQIPCVDIASLFSHRPDLFADYTHHNAEGHRLIAEAVAKQAASMLWK